MPDPTEVERLFDEALELPPGDRREFLDRSCDGDVELRAELESLLAADASAGGFLEPPVETSPSGDAELGRTVGNWRLLELIGTGGMGRVYLGERADGAFDKRVAVKLIRIGLGSPETVERFDRERRVLAALEHPHIAGLIDGGATADGTPFLVMEHVDGVPIGRYCDERGLDVSARLRLFRDVCAAVEHAHRNLVVHRDLKPSNILVTADGTVKLLDFGIAKVLGDDTAVTRTGLRPLTPRYASPEQLRGGAITTTSDVYSLGVVLFELISGGRPHRTDELSASEIERAVTEGTPSRPSAAVEPARIAELEGGRAALARRLSGDLDTIVLTAIRREPERRYGSVERLSDDIARHLEGFPVSARPDTFGYRASRFIVRHRARVIAAAALAGALVAGTAVSVHFALRERDQRALADRRFAEVRDLATTFLTDVDEAIATRGKTEARETIVSTGLTYLDRLAEEAGEDPGLLRDIASGYFRVARIQGDPKSPSLGDVPAALSSVERGQRIASRLDPRSAATRLLRVEGHLLAGDLARHVGDRGRALEQFEAALAERLEVEGRELAKPRLDTVHFRLGYALERFGESARAVEHFERSRAIVDALIERHPAEASLFRAQAVTSIALAQAYRFGGQPEKTLELLPPIAERLAERAREHTELRPVLANLRYNLGWAYVDEGDLARGTAEISGTVDFYRSLARADPGDLTARRNAASGLHDLGELALESGEPARSLGHYEEMVELRRHVVERSPQSVLFRNELGLSLMALAGTLEVLGREREARERFAEAAALFEGISAELPEADEYRQSAVEARRRAGP